MKLELCDGQATGFIDNQPVVASMRFSRGRPSFYARASGGRFEKARFPSCPRGLRASHHAQFARGQTMAGWASAAASWSRDIGGSRFSGIPGSSREMPSVTWDLPGGNAPRPDARPERGWFQAETGYQALLSVSARKRERLELKRQGQSVAQSGRWEPGSPLRVWRSGHLIAAALGDCRYGAVSGPAAFGGRTNSAFSAAREVNFASGLSLNPHVLDCTFSGPPTEWWAPGSEVGRGPALAM